MWDMNILLFIVMFVLSVAFSDTFFAEFIIFIFAIMQFSEALTHGVDIVTSWDYMLGGYLFVLNALYAFLCMVLWVSDNKKAKEEPV